MKYSRAAITNAGASLLQSLAISSGTLNITYVKFGDGSYSSSEDLKTKTQLKSLKQQFEVSQIDKDANDQIRIITVATNEGLAEGYYMTEMGVFALDENEQEILVAIAVVHDAEDTDYMPQDDQTFPTSINVLSYIKVSNNVSVTTVSESGYVSLAEYLLTKQKVESISVTDDGDGNVVLTLPI